MRFRKPEWVDEMPSTNVALRERLLGGTGLPNGYVLATRHQTAGRGRYDREWTSGRMGDLTFSLLLRTVSEPMRIPSLPMAVALAVADLLTDHGLRDVATKWPNDVLAGTRKICGILAESVATDSEDTAIIVGVGLNVNMTAEGAAMIDQPATSMRIETGCVFDIDGLLEDLLDGLTGCVADWEAGGFSALRDRWEQCCAFQGETVTVRDGERTRTGRLKRFGEHGELILEELDGSLREVWSGDMARGPSG